MALGKYEIVCRLSTGGMSEIFLGYQRGIGGFRKMVVLKTILPDTRGQEEVVRMFLNEARVTAELNHPNIVQVYELGIDNDMLFLAMEYIQGCSMIEMVRACAAVQQNLPMGFVLTTVRDTALALWYAHTFVDMRHRKRPVIHRDIAGKNIMVSYEGTTKLLDFGIAKMQGTDPLTFAGTVKGTTGYMSPEQLLGKPLDGRSDIFSLGIVIHECLTGYRLFHETQKKAVLSNEIHAPSAFNSSIPKALDAVIMKALEKKPDKRFQSALEFARALEGAAGEHMWKAEQVGQLVSLHFAKRREHTRKLLEEVRERLKEFTGQVEMEDFLQKNPFDSNPPRRTRGDGEPTKAFLLGEEEQETTSPTQEQARGRSALIPLRLPSSCPQTDALSSRWFSPLLRFFSNRYFALFSFSAFLGVVLAVLLFWILTGFGPAH